MSERERLIAGWLLTDKNERQIAKILGLSIGVVHHAVVTIYRKFAVNSRAQFMAIHHQRDDLDR